MEDLKSTNGTWVGDERIDMFEIEGDQAIRIGSVTLSVRLENRLPTKPTAHASPRDDVPTTEPVVPAKKSAPLPATPAATPAATPTAAHTGSIRLVATTRQNHSRRLTLRFGQQAVLGRSDQVEFPMINDHSLAAEQLSIRFEAGFCVVSTLANEPPAFLGKELLTKATRISPGDQIRVGETTLEMQAGQAIESTAPARSIVEQPLESGVFYSGSRDEFDWLNSKAWQAARGEIIGVYWPPHSNRDPLSHPEPLFDWAAPKDSPRLEKSISTSEVEVPLVAFLPKHSAASAIETVRLVSRGQTRRYAVASPRFSWVGREPAGIAELLRDGPAATRATLLGQTHWLACFNSKHWFLLGDGSLALD